MNTIEPPDPQLAAILQKLEELQREVAALKDRNDAEPPISVSLFSEKTGLSETTIWRYRGKGWLNTYNIAGRQYLSRAEITEFNRRMKSGEFASEPSGCAAATKKKKQSGI